MSIMNRQTFWLKRGLKKLISEVDLIIDWIFGKLQQTVLDNEETFENFTNLMIQMFIKTQTNVFYGNCCGQCQIYIDDFYKEILIFFSENGPK